MGWWMIAVEWKEIAEGLPHGQVEAQLEIFARSRGLQPISVRKASAGRRFVEDLELSGVVDRSDRLTSLPFQRIEALRRLSRYGDIHFRALAQRVISGELVGRALKDEERRLRSESAARPDDCGQADVNTHAFRLRSSLFARSIVTRLPVLYPSPLRHFVPTRKERNAFPVACDLIIEGGRGYKALNLVAVRSGGDANAFRRNVLHLGLAGSRVFSSYVFLCQRAEEADEILAEFDAVPPCGVGVSLVEGDGLRTLRPATRDAPPDLSNVVDGLLAHAFSRQNGGNQDARRLPRR